MAHHSSSVVHSVHFYDQDEALILRLRSIICSAIDTGNSVLIVATPEHRKQLAAALMNHQQDAQGLEKDGRLILRDAHETLSNFMINGPPDRELFVASIGELLAIAKQTAWNSNHGLTVFGEMVAVLWKEGNTSGGLKLEALWNDLLSDRAFHLHCAYPRSLFADNGDAASIEAICDGHSHVIGYAVN